MSEPFGISKSTARDTSDEVDPKPTPFVIGVVGRLSSVTPPKLKERRFVTVNATNFQTFFRHAGSRIAVTPDLGLPEELRFESLDDFTPTGLCRALTDRGSTAATAEVTAKKLWSEGNLEQVRATWVGLKYLVDRTRGLATVRLKALDCSKPDALKDLRRAAEFDQSGLFKKIHEQEFGTFGGEPFGCLVLDYWIGPNPEDLELTEKLSNIAAVASVPMFLGLNPDLFSVKAWQELNPEFSSAWMLDAACRSAWAGIRTSDDAEFCFGFLPRVRVSRREEDPEASWIHPGFTVAALAAQSFRERDLAATDIEPAEPPIPAPFDLDCEWNCPDVLVQSLRQAGLNVFTRNSVLGNIVSLAKPGIDGSVRSLAKCLLISQLRTSLNSHLRWKRSSNSYEALYCAAEEWVEKLQSLEETRSGRRPVEIVSMEPGYTPGKDYSYVRINFRILPGLISAEEHPEFVLGGWTHDAVVHGLNLYRGLPDSQGLRIVALIDLNKTPELSPYSRPLSDPDDLTPVLGLREINVTVSGVEPDRHLEVKLDLRESRSLEPDEIAKQIPRLKQLEADRAQLLNLIAYADLSSNRRAALGGLVEKYGCLWAIPLKMEGWKSAIAGGQDAPVSADEIDQSLPVSRLSDWNVDWDLRAAIELWEEWIGRAAQAERGAAWQRIHAGIVLMDDLIWRYVAAIYNDPVLHLLECAKESLHRLVSAIPAGASVEVMDVHSGFRDHLADPLGYQSCPRRNILIFETDQFGTAEVTVSQDLLSFGQNDDITDIRGLLKLETIQRTIVLLGLRGCSAPPTILKELAESPLGTSLVICAADIEIQRRPRTGWPHRLSATPASALPRLSSSGIYDVAAELARRQDLVFGEEAGGLDEAAGHLSEDGWSVSNFGRALFLTRK